MSGVESVATCEMHRNKAQKLFANFDEKYIQKWVLHDEAVDLMVLKVQKFAMEDHYARLYGPRVMARNTVMTSMRARSPSDFNRDSLAACNIDFAPNVEDPVGKKETKKVLANAFAAHPFSKYQTADRVKMESAEDLQNLLKDAENRSSLIWKTAFSKVRIQSVVKKAPEEENEEEQIHFKKKIDIPTILQLYQEAKKETDVKTENASD